MANFIFEGETNILSEKQVKFLCDVLEKQDFRGSKITIATLGQDGDNYSSNVKTITAEREDGKILKMVAKIAPTSEFLRTTVNTEIVFGNEFMMYDKVLPKFLELEIEAEIREEDRLKFPVCYGIYQEILHEMILLEDLRECDYVMRDRFQPLKDEEIKIILKAFAKLHSLSFVLKSKDPELYKELTSKLSDMFSSRQMQENEANSFKIMEENFISLFDVDKYRDKIRGCMSTISTEARKLNKCDAGSRYSVIVHGDSWTNNILLKLNDKIGIPEGCMLIDYQLSAERCPVSDLLYLIMSCTDYDTRSIHYNDWMDGYYENLDNYLANYGIKANYVYPKEKMLADLKRYSKFFLGWSLIIANVLCMDIESATKLKSAMNSSDDTEEILENMKADGVVNVQSSLKAKVQGIIDSYYELGYCS